MDFLTTLNNQEHNAVECAVFDYLRTELEENILKYSKKDFEKYLTESITDFYYDAWCDSELIDDDEDIYDEIYVYFNTIILCFFEINVDYPPRSSCQYTIINNEDERDKITKQIGHLKSVDQPKQKTDEWYTYRHNMLTASTIWKIFGSEASINSIIYEKCNPLNTNRVYSNSLVWGNMFEPVSIEFYENYYKTKIDDFGCILHPNLHMIGASPDGINVDPNSSKYGTMLEIKNIVNRDIDGIPKEEYWIQMQIQMETCDLDVCDFLETRFVEYSEDEYYEDKREIKGIVMYFVKDFGSDMKYLYKPFGMTDRKEVDRWQSDQCDSMMVIGYSKTRVVHWYLDEFSCIAVTRNINWFEKAQPVIENVYNIIQKEKETGFDHRAPKKNKKVITVTQTDQSDNQLIHNLEVERRINLVKLDGDSESKNET